MLQDGTAGISHQQFLLLLHSVPHIGEMALARLLRLNALNRLSPQEFLTLSEQELRDRYDLHPEAATYLDTHREALVQSSSGLLKTILTHQILFLSIESVTYPTRLEKNDDAPPPLLYLLGNHALLNYFYDASRFTFTIALSNGASKASLALLETLAEELIDLGGIPVTGHDRVPYQRLALCAQRKDRPTIFVLDRGLRDAMGKKLDKALFPAARIRETNFNSQRDLVVSSFRMDDHSLGDHNRRRDRLIFCLADLTIALDIRANGVMHAETARILQQQRPLFVASGGRDGNQALRDAGCPLLPEKRNAAWFRKVLEVNR